MSSPSKETPTFAFKLSPVRESRLLGKKLHVERSTALGFSPDTFCRVLFGKGIRRLLEEHEYSIELGLRALDRAETQGSKMHKSVRDDFERLLSRATVGNAPLNLERLRNLPPSLSGPWRILRVTMAKYWSRYDKRLINRLAYYDRIASQIGMVRDPTQAVAVRKRFFLESVSFWRAAETPLGDEIALCVDATIQHLAWFDRTWAATHTWYPTGTLNGLANPEKKPIRHWFDGVLVRTRTADLNEFQKHLAAQGALHLGRPIEHDLLKKWASSQHFIPAKAADALLASCSTAVREIERYRLWLAKLMTFLVECVVCFSPQEVKPVQAQRCIHRRLELIQEHLQANQRLCGHSLFVV